MMKRNRKMRRFKGKMYTVGCRVEGRAIDTALGQCCIPNSSH